MAAAVRLREDYEAAQLRALAKRSADAAQTRRLLALAAIYDGGSRGEAAKIGGGGLATGRGWGVAVNARGPAGADQRQGARQGAAARCRQAPGLGAGCRGGPYPGGARGGALAAHRSGAVGVRPLRDFDQQADLEPRIARPWLSQTVGPAAPSCPGRRGRRCL